MSFLESLMSSFSSSLLRMMAAAVTGPAMQPLPASSVPTSMRFEYDFFNINRC